jgi:hypothetical protein
MNRLCRQAAIGACVALVLALGANAGPNDSRQPRAQTHHAVMFEAGAISNRQIASVSGGVLSIALQEQGATLATALRTCRDKILGAALDAYGEIAARLKQV